MSGKDNGTAASKAHAPEQYQTDVHDSAYYYPGKPIPKGEKLSDAKHNQAAMESGRSNSLGQSKDGSHKGIPSGKEVNGEKGKVI